MLTSRYVLTALLLTVSACSSEERPSPPSTPVTQRKPITPTVTREPTKVDLRWTSIPGDFAPSDPAETLRKLTFGPQDEFETTAQFAKRLATMADTALIAFAYSADETYYDADRRRWVVYLRPGETNPHAGTGSKQYGITIWDKQDTLGTYMATNAFGASQMVTRTRYESIVVSLRDGIALESADPELRMSPDSARTLKERLRYLLVIRPRQAHTGAFVTDSTTNERPTLGNLRELVRRSRTLWASSIALWIFDSESRRILAKRSIH